MAWPLQVLIGSCTPQMVFLDHCATLHKAADIDSCVQLRSTDQLAGWTASCTCCKERCQPQRTKSLLMQRDPALHECLWQLFDLLTSDIANAD
jgi:hypothetical protein